ncbi:hypothetical protein H6G11_10760 [Cyanobacterium aponinum FACHB-4101]|uniref:glycosyltransferase n=1 Tax=Cyanobacterium aponinum TaxID=379064 RepID=UPI001680D6DD|nr:hypothetical protein [Cyanobacterium aponinum]MBD2394731.1 hypothetical protein [Cyanobacterium aponinum FACHB-4101]
MINSQTKNNPLFISLIPNLMGGEGHIIPYHQSITKAMNILGWHHEVIYSTEDNLPSLPSHWQGCVKGNQLEEKANIFQTIKDVDLFAKTIKIFLEQRLISNSNQPIIIFIERFIHLQLFSLLLAINNLPKDNLYIWVLYRHNFHQHKTKGIYKLLNKLLKKSVKKDHFHLFSDSELLANSMEKYFNESFTVMPIPHTEFVDKNRDRENNSIICWWAGPPREEKGWQVIRNLADYPLKNGDNFVLVTAKSADLVSINGGVKVITIDDNLSRLDYIHWLQKTDIMLIPYDAIAYQERTSGVFTEAVMAGNIPLTTTNTWMARELLKFGLDNLIISWENPESVWQHIEKVFHCQETRCKLKKMQESYRNIHNIHNFAHQFLISLA